MNFSREPNHNVDGGFARPSALLLDFGGVIADTEPAPEWEHHTARHVDALLASCSHPAPPVDNIAADILRAVAAEAQWRNRASHSQFPRELSAREFWLDFVGRNWPESCRKQLADHAQELSDTLTLHKEIRMLRHGIPELLQHCRAHSIPLGIVSNTTSATVYRDQLAAWNLLGFFHTAVFSAEAGTRKPNPQLIIDACTDLEVNVSESWYVGDTYDRDVQCGTRAGVGCCVLMRSSRTETAPGHDTATAQQSCESDQFDGAATAQPDLIVCSPFELLHEVQRFAQCGSAYNEP
jgi:HAD superfamily hydrolase (TIGR01549 family)